MIKYVGILCVMILGAGIIGWWPPRLDTPKGMLYHAQKDLESVLQEDNLLQRQRAFEQWSVDYVKWPSISLDHTAQIQHQIFIRYIQNPVWRSFLSSDPDTITVVSPTLATAAYPALGQKNALVVMLEQHQGTWKIQDMMLQGFSLRETLL